MTEQELVFGVLVKEAMLRKLAKGGGPAEKSTTRTERNTKSGQQPMKARGSVSAPGPKGKSIGDRAKAMGNRARHFAKANKKGIGAAAAGVGALALGKKLLGGKKKPSFMERAKGFLKRR